MLDKLTHALWIALILTAFALAGRVDMLEAERLSMEGYINAHSEVVMVADSECH